MRTLTIGFSSSTKKFPIFCWLIKLMERTNFSHVYVKNETRYNIDLIYQASGTQVNFMNTDIFHMKNKTIKEFEFKVSDEAFDKYMKFALNNCGRPYGVKQILGIAIMKILNLPNNPFPNGVADYVCSELVAEVLCELGKFKYDRATFDRLTPKDIYKFCNEIKEE